MKSQESLETLIPVDISAYTNDSVLGAAKMYEHELLDNGLINLKAELIMWRNRQKNSGPKKPESAIEVMYECIT